MINPAHYLLALASVFAGFFHATADAGIAIVTKPNILWIVTEDIGCYIACYGTNGLHAPNINQLATEGHFIPGPTRWHWRKWTDDLK